MLSIDFELMGLADGQRLLDIGCGVGRHVISGYLLKDIDAIGVDRCLADLKTAAARFEQDFRSPAEKGKRLLLAAGDALVLPFTDCSFDQVICSEVLEHIPDYQAALLEIRRVLKSGGVLAVSVPRFWPEWICWWLSRAYHQEPGGHIRIFRASRLQKNIEDLNFQFYHRHWAHSLHVFYWWLQCLFWSNRERSKLVKIYHRLLVWDLMKKPWLTRVLDKMLNPLIGKSIVMYFQKD